MKYFLEEKNGRYTIYYQGFLHKKYPVYDFGSWGWSFWPDETSWITKKEAEKMLERLNK